MLISARVWPMGEEALKWLWVSVGAGSDATVREPKFANVTMCGNINNG